LKPFKCWGLQSNSFPPWLFPHTKVWWLDEGALFLHKPFQKSFLAKSDVLNILRLWPSFLHIPNPLPAHLATSVTAWIFWTYS
jgi:hypothetical protein